MNCSLKKYVKDHVYCNLFEPAPPNRNLTPFCPLCWISNPLTVLSGYFYLVLSPNNQQYLAENIEQHPLKTMPHLSSPLLKMRHRCCFVCPPLILSPLGLSRRSSWPMQFFSFKVFSHFCLRCHVRWEILMDKYLIITAEVNVFSVRFTVSTPGDTQGASIATFISRNKIASICGRVLNTASIWEEPPNSPISLESTRGHLQQPIIQSGVGTRPRFSSPMMR